jgi:hypothetical protein
MMLSEEAGGTPSSDLLGERAAAFDVLSIGIPTSTPVMEITYGGSPGLVPRQQSNYRNYTGNWFWNWLLELVTGNRNPRDAHLAGERHPEGSITNYQSQ